MSFISCVCLRVVLMERKRSEDFMNLSRAAKHTRRLSGRLPREKVQNERNVHPVKINTRIITA